MHKEGPHDPQLSIEAGYEVSDMNARIVVISGVVLAVSIIASVIISIFIVRGLDRRSPMNTTPASPLTAELRTPPPGPLLQMDPVADKEAIIDAAQARLGSYGIVDENPEAARAHVPIDLAIDLVAEQKVPYRQEPVNALLTPVEPSETREPAPSPILPAPPAAIPQPERDPAAGPGQTISPEAADSPQLGAGEQVQVSP